MEYQNILLDRIGGVGRITLNRPDNRNALTIDMVKEVTAGLRELQADENARAIVVTGTGTAFSAGADLSGFQKRPYVEARERASAGYELHSMLPRLGKPVIAAVNGYCLAGGCGLAMSCDFVIASEKAKFGYPEIKRALVPAIVLPRLQRLVGKRKALELVLFGDMIDANEAERIGMITRVVPHDDLMTIAMERANTLASMSGVGMRMCRDFFYAIQDMEYQAALNYCRDLNLLMRETEDSQEGSRSFLEKRDPVWKHR